MFFWPLMFLLAIAIILSSAKLGSAAKDMALPTKRSV
jgi:hypothetical protein